ncbi:MAG: hypothetical protein ACREEM_24155 [Blastocatellia bacterium]
MDLKGIFDSLYDKLVLRDLFGKVVPGSAFLLYAFSGLLGLETVDRLLNKMTVTLWVIAIGFAWLIAFALQFLGESCGMLKTHPSIRQKPEGLLTSTEPEDYKTPDEQKSRNIFYEKWASFHELAESHERVYAERLSVIKEACGNGAVSIALITVGLIISLFVSLIRGKGAWYPLLPFLAWLVFWRFLYGACT